MKNTLTTLSVSGYHVKTVFAQQKNALPETTRPLNEQEQLHSS